jgi:RNA polymerase sigma-70 factor (ECF subfamily)
MAAQRDHPVHQLVDHLFRHEAGKMVAVLTRHLGSENLSIAEDIVQETLLKAMENWRFRGVPDHPSAWLYKVAHNKTIDWLRSAKRAAKWRSHQKEGHDIEDRIISPPLFTEDEIDDSVLRMMFACCHPAIPIESQVALTLKTLGGLSILEIADAFLTSEETIAKRIYRAKERIRRDKIKLEPPGIFDLAHRMDSVLQVLYLLFNEGYHSSHSDRIIREDLCGEAMRLAHLLTQRKATNLPKVNALLALMCFQSSRFSARTGELGEIILLEHQDRSKWNNSLIQQGHYFLTQASTGNHLSEYHVEASIAAIHCTTSQFEKTPWDKLLILYEILAEIKPGPMVSFNKAITIGYAKSSAEGIKELLLIRGLENHYLYLTALGSFYFLQKDPATAITYFEKALSQTTSTKEAELIMQKLRVCYKNEIHIN